MSSHQILPIDLFSYNMYDISQIHNNREAQCLSYLFLYMDYLGSMVNGPFCGPSLKKLNIWSNMSADWSGERTRRKQQAYLTQQQL